MDLAGYGRKEIVKFLGREGAVLDRLELFEIYIYQLPRLPLSGEALLGDCLHTMRNLAWHQKGMQTLQGFQTLQ